MSWILSSRNLKESIYTDGHGVYTVITHSRGICNEKIIPPLAIKKDRRGFNNNYHLLQQVRPIATEKNAPRVQQTHRGIKRAYRERL